MNNLEKDYKGSEKMRLNLKLYNVLLSNNDNSTIGYSNDIINLYKDYIKQLVDDMQGKHMIKDLRNEISMILDMLFDIYTKSDEWYEPQLIKLYYNPMVAYMFKVLKEEEE